MLDTEQIRPWLAQALPQAAAANLATITILGLLGASAVAQSSAQVTDADIERARKSQPVITEKDIERAVRQSKLPTDFDSDRPATSASRIDRLPQPLSPRNIDLGKIANGYETSNSISSILPAAKPRLLVFVSFSMGDATLRKLIEQTARAQGTVVLRGFQNNSLVGTVAHARRLVGKTKVAIQIDPQAFEQFAVSSVPTFVLVRAGEQGTPCGNATCISPEGYAKTAGDVSTDYALEHIERMAPRFAKDARVLLNRLRG